MSDLKTRPNDKDVYSFIEAIHNEAKRKDCHTLHALMKKVSREKAVMWGESIVGYGSYQYKYKSGRSGSWLLTGFSPRVQAISIYIMSGFAHYTELLDRLGTYKTSVACLYVKRLSDIDLGVLEELIDASVKDMREYWKQV